MNKNVKQQIKMRLRRIEGQIAGLTKMIEADRYCIDVLTQFQAVRAALAKAEEKILEDHLHHCVTHAMQSGNLAEQNRKIDELVNVVGRLTK